MTKTPFRDKTAADEVRYIAGRKLWTLPEAIETIAAMEGFGVSAEALRARVQGDAEQGKITLRHEEHGAPLRSDWGAVVLRWFLYAEDFNDWLELAGYPAPYRLTDGLALERKPAPEEGAPVTHELKSRAEPLAAVLVRARATALDPDDWQSVWAALVKLAQSPDRPAPLLGYTEGEGVQYQKDDVTKPVDWLSRDAYRKRHSRRK